MVRCFLCASRIELINPAECSLLATQIKAPLESKDALCTSYYLQGRDAFTAVSSLRLGEQGSTLLIPLKALCDPPIRQPLAVLCR